MAGGLLDPAAAESRDKPVALQCCLGARRIGGPEEVDVIIHADNDFFFLVHSHLVAVGSFRNFALWVAAFDGGNHAAHGVDSLDVIPSAALDFVGQGLDKIRATERIDRIRDTGFVGDNLLRAESDRGRELGGERPSLVERIGVQRLRAARTAARA